MAAVVHEVCKYAEINGIFLKQYSCGASAASEQGQKTLALTAYIIEESKYKKVNTRKTDKSKFSCETLCKEAETERTFLYD